MRSYASCKPDTDIPGVAHVRVVRMRVTETKRRREQAIAWQDTPAPRGSKGGARGYLDAVVAKIVDDKIEPCLRNEIH